jgi:hypothetical protein
MLPRNQEKIRFETVLHLERGTRIHISQKRAEIFDFATHRTANRPHFVSNLIGSSGPGPGLDQSCRGTLRRSFY